MCNLLSINTNVLEMPKDGFTQEAMDNEEARAFSRGKRIVRTVLSAICNLVSPSNAKLRDNMMNVVNNKLTDSNLISNATKLVFFGNRNIAQSLLAKSIQRDQLKKILQHESERYPDHPLVQKLHFDGFMVF